MFINRWYIYIYIPSKELFFKTYLTLFKSRNSILENIISKLLFLTLLMAFLNSIFNKLLIYFYTFCILYYIILRFTLLNQSVIFIFVVLNF